MKKLDIEQAEQLRKKFAPDWEIRKGLYLYKKVALNDYNQVLRFLMAVEKAQIKLDHFADFMNFYNELTIAITTHDVNGLTQLDFELALYIDQALEQMGARQLEEKWSTKYKRSINCSNPKGFSQRAHCQGRKKNESISEGYKIQLERDSDMYVLHITDTQTGKRTEVRGKSGYESGGYDANDKLHQLLDRIGKTANVSELINGEVVTINPKHPDADRAKAATDKAYSENFADGKVKGKSRPGRVKRAGASCNGSVTDLRRRAKNSSGEKARMYHWCANMKSGRKKK